MNIDYQKTIDTLKEMGLIAEGDKYAVCLFQPETENLGVVTRTTTSEVDYIMVANETEVKLFDIDKKTGEFLEHYCVFVKENLVFEKKNKNWIIASKGLFGGRYIGIRADYVGKFCHTYVLPKKIHGFRQEELRNDLYEFIKTVYKAHYDEQKRIYKANK